MSADFSSCSKRLCVAFVSNTISCVLSLRIYGNFKTKSQSCHTTSHMEYLNSSFGCLVMGWLRGRYRGTQECHKVASPKSSVVFGRPEELSKGRVGISWGWPHKGKTVPLSESCGEACFSHHRELVRQTGRRVSARTIERPLRAAGYRSRRPARCPRLTHDHRRRWRVWARRHWSWNH